jgi:oxygen-dependent protoporphyrinogen oxidase
VADVIVVGGGLAGLLTGAEMKRRGLQPLVLEGTALVGGVAQSVVDDGFLLEPAAGSLLLPNPDLDPVMEAAGVEFAAAKPEARTRFVYDRGTLFEVPESPKFLFTKLVSLRAKLRAAREPWITTPPPDGEESLLGFFTRRFGRDVGLLGASLMAHGVFAGDPAALSIQAAFPKMVALEAEAGSVIRGAMQRRKARPEDTPRARVHVAPGGMVGVSGQLETYLGGDLRLSAPVAAVRRDGDGWQVEWDGGSETAPAVIVALAPNQAAPLLPDPLGGLVADRPVAPVAVVGLGGPAESFRLPDGFGVLAGPDAGIRALGILFESSYAAGRAPEGYQLAKGIYGGAADPDIMSRSDEEIVSLMSKELGLVVGTVIEPTWTRVVRSSIPQYPLGHAAWLADVDRALAELPGLHVAGWGYRGIGVSSLGADAVRLGDVLANGPTT